MEIDLQDLLIHSLHLSLGECSSKVIVVTGAGRGIGLQTARAFALLGGKVVIAELSEQGRQVEAEICQAGGKALFVQADVSDAGSVQRLAEMARSAFGPVDILVNNAIRITESPVVEMDTAVWDSIIAVNLRGTFLTCKAFLPEMLARGGGTIINMISTDAMPGLSAYIASKQGIVGFSQSLALEVGQQGIQVIPFTPGMVDTPGIRSVSGGLAPRLGLTQEQFLNLSLHAAYEGLMPPEHAGAATVYLALRLAKEYHGQTINGYEVLERAGLLQVSPVETALSAELPSSDHSGSKDALPQLKEVLDIVVETAREFEKLPAFVRPLARNGFKGKAGASLDDWQRSLAHVQVSLENDTPSGEASHGLISRLEKLITYYQGVPGETARFTRDKVLLAEVAELSNRRIAAIRRLIEALQ